MIHVRFVDLTSLLSIWGQTHDESQFWQKLNQHFITQSNYVYSSQIWTILRNLSTLRTKDWQILIRDKLSTNPWWVNLYLKKLFPESSSCLHSLVAWLTFNTGLQSPSVAEHTRCAYIHRSPSTTKLISCYSTI